MPFCTQCGKNVREIDLFCDRCGAAQQAGRSWSSAGSTAGFAAPPDPLGGVSSRTAAILCYIPLIGWIPSIVVLASERFRKERETRFHAFQALYLFVAWLIVDWALDPILRLGPGPRVPIGGLLKLTLFAAWIYMLVKVSQFQSARLPILGELADRSVAEQR